MNKENRESEIKLAIQDLAAVSEILKQLAAVLKQPRHFEDNVVFDTQTRELRQSGLLLRIRTTDQNAEATLTFKGKASVLENVKHRDEIECAIANVEQFKRILSGLGYEPTFQYQKYRTIYRLAGIDVCVDETPIGNYYELEGDPHDIHEYAKKLGYSRDQYITDSYAGLYFKYCRDRDIQPGRMIFP